MIKNWSGLDAFRYIGMPSLAYDMFLKTTKVRIKLLTDRRQVNMIERGIRGGLSFASTRYLKAGKKKTQAYWDQNNLVSISNILKI